MLKAGKKRITEKSKSQRINYRANKIILQALVFVACRKVKLYFNRTRCGDKINIISKIA
jgi:hypothetical protein